MSGLGLTIDASSLDGLFTQLDSLGGAITGDEMALEIGREAQQAIKEHLEEIAGDSAHHRSSEALGGERTGFYEEAASKVQAPQTEPGGVSVSIDHQGLAQRYFGGDIEAKEGSFLTIPARAETYGHRAREFDNLQLIIFPSGAGALIEKSGSGGSKLRGGKGEALSPIDKLGSDVWFWLVKHVHQEGDPTVLPDDSEILDRASAAAQNFIDVVGAQLKAA